MTHTFHRVLHFGLAASLAGLAWCQEAAPAPAAEPAAAAAAPAVQPEAAPAAPAVQPEAAPAAPAPVAKEVPAFNSAVETAIGPRVEGKGRVVFFRPSKFVGAAIGFIVREDKAELGKLRSGNFFTIQAEPGKHTYTVHSEATDNTTLEVEAGETYFVIGSISMGFLVGHPHLACTEVTSFEAALPKLSPSKPLS